MIKINLLTEKKVKKKEPLLKSSAKRFLINFIAFTAITLVVMLAITYYLSSSKDDLSAQYQHNQVFMTQLQKSIQDLKKYESMNNAIQQKMTLIETLRKNQAIPVRILDEVSMLLPNGVWLSSLVYKGDIVTIEGYAFTNLDIVSYIDNFKRSTITVEPTLEESKYEELDKVPLYKFKLSFKIKVGN
ncbi:MAG: PilN domain-containing protein [Thermodesulfovibrionales bacterium]|nr:PilN domain-containing protein [Thermodesulfovibrionales bacterium]